MTRAGNQGPAITDVTADAATCDNAQLAVEEAADELVRDVMLVRAKTLPGNATASDARAFFADPKKLMAVLVDGSRFVGVLGRGDIPSLVPDAGPIRGYARRDVPTTRPDRPVTEAMDVLDATASSRLVVLGDDDHTFAGLLCLDTKRAGFCR